MTKIDKIKIGGMVYVVNRVPDLRHPDGRKLDGHILDGDCRIDLEANLPFQPEMQTIWHEVVHGILIHAGRGELKEEIIDALAYGIIQVLYDNPLLGDVKP